MRKLFLTLQLLSFTILAFSQSAVVQQINKVVSHDVALEPMYFLASDELMGRSPLRPEINVAARYISSKFQSFGLKKVEGLDDYYQNFTINFSVPPASGGLTLNKASFPVGSALLQLEGEDVNIDAPVFFAGYTSTDQLSKEDIKGKIVITNFGASDTTNFSDALKINAANKEAAANAGALAMVVRFRQTRISWSQFQHRYNQPLVRGESTKKSFPYFLVNDTENNLPAAAAGDAKSTIVTTGNSTKNVPARNVMGWLKGTDPKLSEQFIVLSAHYDHIGIATAPKMEEGKMDSIYNGARDNAIGVTGVINAARYFSQHPPKRSILFIAFTAEELGLVGSHYYSENPALPLKKVVYDLNIDNGGYNDTTIVSVVGLGRTSADNDFKTGAAAFGLTAKPDPDPSLNLFDRSDNVNFAVKGVPAPTFGMGMKTFDSTMMKRYHQLSDETGDLNTGYVLKYIKAFILSAKNIADNPVKPVWKKGDKYEEAYRKLYMGE